MKKALLIVNTGTPDSPGTGDVRRYLSKFLNDHRVIDIPWLYRKMLVNLVIVPFRAPKSAKLYRRLWTSDGSPLKVNLEKLTLKLRKKTSAGDLVYGAMRYGNPSIYSALEKIREEKPGKIIVFPLYPQYASPTTGSVHELIMSEISKWEIIPEISFIGQYYSHDAFLDAFVSLIKEYDPDRFDHILFSYHGLPVRQVQKAHPDKDYNSCSCEQEFPAHGTWCYKATCYETTRLLASKLGLKSEHYTTTFQSRLSKAWLKPFTDQVLRELAGNNKKRVLVVAPSFVADCLETIIEIGDEYRTLFIGSGGVELVMSRSLNDDSAWAEAIITIAGI